MTSEKLDFSKIDEVNRKIEQKTNCLNDENWQKKLTGGDDYYFYRYNQWRGHFLLQIHVIRVSGAYLYTNFGRFRLSDGRLTMVKGEVSRKDLFAIPKPANPIQIKEAELSFLTESLKTFVDTKLKTLTIEQLKSIFLIIESSN